MISSFFARKLPRDVHARQVTWDNGFVDDYRTGFEGQFRLMEAVDGEEHVQGKGYRVRAGSAKGAWRSV